jgi:hypothetical protein
MLGSCVAVTGLSAVSASSAALALAVIYEYYQYAPGKQNREAECGSVIRLRNGNTLHQCGRSTCNATLGAETVGGFTNSNHTSDRMSDKTITSSEGKCVHVESTIMKYNAM